MHKCETVLQAHPIFHALQKCVVIFDAADEVVKPGETKEVFFYLSPEARKRENITVLFNFIRKHLGSEFYTGTKKTNKRFIDFANKNGWVVWLEDENNVIFKATI